MLVPTLERPSFSRKRESVAASELFAGGWVTGLRRDRDPPPARNAPQKTLRRAHHGHGRSGRSARSRAPRSTDPADGGAEGRV